MGLGDVTFLFCGLSLEDQQADLLYGLARQYFDSDPRVDLPGDRRDSRYVLDRPHAPRPGRHWIGVVLERCGPLPRSLQDRVWSASQGDVAAECRFPGGIPSDATLNQEWQVFADWCTRRGLHLPEPGLYIVSDYL